MTPGGERILQSALKEVAVEINDWWAEDRDEVFWMEITDRTNLGADLNAPQLADDGNEFWGYSLLKEIGDGDVV